MIKPSFFVAALAATLTLACISPSQAALFLLEDLGPLDSNLMVSGITSNATAFGYAGSYGTNSAVLQPLNQSMQVLTGLIGTSISVNGVNTSGIVAGNYWDVNTQKQWGFRLTPGSPLKTVKAPPGVALSSISSMSLSGINSSNRIVGNCVINGSVYGFVNRVYRDFNLRLVETTTLLKTPSSFIQGHAYGIGENGTIFGAIVTSSHPGFAALWNPDGSYITAGGFIKILIPDGAQASWAECIAPNGRVAGVATYADGSHLFRTNSAGGSQDLGYHDLARVKAINSAGALIANNYLNDDYPLYISPGGNKYNLNTVSIGSGMITRILNSHSIDEAGNILATAVSVWGEKRIVRLNVIDAE